MDALVIRDSASLKPLKSQLLLILRDEISNNSKIFEVTRFPVIIAPASGEVNIDIEVPGTDSLVLIEQNEGHIYCSSLSDFCDRNYDAVEFKKTGHICSLGSIEVNVETADSFFVNKLDINSLKSEIAKELKGSITDEVFLEIKRKLIHVLSE